MAVPDYMGLPEAEWRVLAALAWMVEQYLGRAGGHLDNECIGAGEGAMEALVRYGLVSMQGSARCGEWTELGRRFLDDTWNE